MNSKRLVLTILLSIACITPLFAQQSAQATMKVQVTVLEGNAITMKQQPEVVLNKLEDSNRLTELSTITVNKKPGSVFILERPERLELADEHGTNFEIPVIYSDELTEMGIITKMNIAPIKDSTLTKSSYKGSVTTRVAYL